MAIVINEFEVIVEPPPAPQSDAAAPHDSRTQPAPMRPDEIVTVMQVHEERLKRVRAN